MKNRNRLERFSDIAKRLVDDHSAQLFKNRLEHDAYSNHLEAIGQQLEINARDFIGSLKTNNEELTSQVWNTCSKYLDLFIKRNDPDRENLHGAF